MTRFLRNPAVMTDEMVTAAGRRTAVRCDGRRVLAIRYTTVALARPRNAVAAGLPNGMSVTLVDVREIDPPPGENIHWRLLTTHPVEDLAQAFAIVGLYRRRWAIEQLERRASNMTHAAISGHCGRGQAGGACARRGLT